MSLTFLNIFYTKYINIYENRTVSGLVRKSGFLRTIDDQRAKNGLEKMSDSQKIRVFKIQFPWVSLYYDFYK